MDASIESTVRALMNIESLYKEILDKYPNISSKANDELEKTWPGTDEEFYIYTWFEALARVLNNEMQKEIPPSNHESLLKLIASSFLAGDENLKKTIDVAFTENLYWQVYPEKAAPYWEVMPEVLKKLYVDFHHKNPL